MKTFVAVSKENGEGELMNEIEVRFRLMGNVKNVDIAINDMINNGQKITTDFNIYQLAS